MWFMNWRSKLVDPTLRDVTSVVVGVILTMVMGTLVGTSILYAMELALTW